jgi:excisionase family DNA binding protein
MTTVVEDRSHLVPTGEAARLLGISRTTLMRWVHAGLVTPAWTTRGGHARWDMDQLERQVEQNDAHDEA